MTRRQPFAHVVRDHGPPVHRFLVAVAGAEHADDCWQETFLAALEAYPTLRKPERVRSWLFSIAHRKAIDITLHHTRGDKNMAARLLGIATRTIYRHLEKQEDGEAEEDLDDGEVEPPANHNAIKIQ